MTLAVGEKVLLSTRNSKTSRPSKKLNDKRTGPCTVSMIINNNAYILHLASTMRNHNAFHLSLLDRYTPSVRGQPPSEPHPMIVKDTQKWEVNRIPDSRRRYRTLHYLVQWAGYNHIRTSWEAATHLKNARDQIDEFHQERPDRLQE
jgi:hypothetical protein